MKLEEISNLITKLEETLNNVSREIREMGEPKYNIDSLSELNLNLFEQSERNPNYYSIPTATSYTTESFRSFKPDESIIVTPLKLSEVFKTNSDSIIKNSTNTYINSTNF
jgi:hypothetical protein